MDIELPPSMKMGNGTIISALVLVNENRVDRRSMVSSRKPVRDLVEGVSRI
jgi:hypothetical protein